MKKIRAVLCCLLSFILVFASVSFASTANLRYFERGVLTDGTNTAYYFIDKDRKELYLTGNGLENARTPDYPNAASGPFAGRTDVTKIIIEEDVARVGDYVFANMTAVDTLEVQSNLLSSESNMSAKAMVGCTSLRHIQGESAFLSTDVLLEVVKGAINAFSGNWIQLALSGVNIVRDGLSGNTLPDGEVRAIVNDYIMTGEEVYLGEMSVITEGYQERLACPCYHENAYHHNYTRSVSKAATCVGWGDYYYHCAQCGDYYYATEIEPLGHNHITTVFIEPTCTVEGITKNYCSRCGEATYTAIPPTGHLHGTWTVGEAAAPGRRGTLVKLCDECAAQMSSKYYVISNSTSRVYKTGIDTSHNTVAEMKAALAVDGYIFHITKNNVALADSGRIGTGTVINSIRPEGGVVTEIATVVLYGDVNGDGLINSADKELIRQDACLDGNNFADGSDYYKAADMDGDGVVDAFDLFYCDGAVTGAREFDQSRPAS